jgi:hypothetical protein
VPLLLALPPGLALPLLEPLGLVAELVLLLLPLLLVLLADPGLGPTLPPPPQADSASDVNRQTTAAFLMASPSDISHRSGLTRSGI